MATISENLLALDAVKQDIKGAIEAQGVSMADTPFTGYAQKVSEISGGGGGGWQPNPNWVAMPGYPAGQAKLYMIAKVTDGLGVTFSVGNSCEVDWGDGSTSSGSGVHSHFFTMGNLTSPTIDDRYKTALITIVPTVAGSGFGSLDLTSTMTYPGTRQTYTLNPIVYISGNANNEPFTSFICYVGTNTQYSIPLLLECVDIINAEITGSFSFRYCRGLRKVNLGINSNVANTQGFLNCDMLSELSEFQCLGTSLASMFSGCFSLTKQPVIRDQSNVTNYAAVYSGCSLTGEAYLDISNISTASYMASLLTTNYNLRRVHIKYGNVLPSSTIVTWQGGNIEKFVAELVNGCTLATLTFNSTTTSTNASTLTDFQVLNMNANQTRIDVPYGHSMTPDKIREFIASLYDRSALAAGSLYYLKTGPNWDSTQNTAITALATARGWTIVS